MLRLSLPILLCVAIPASVTSADTLVINGQEIENARITGLQRGMVQFTSPGRAGMVRLSQIDRIELDDQPLLNQAEQKAAQGKFREAYVLYARAEQKAERGLLRDLALARINQIRRKIEGPLPKIPKQGSDDESDGKFPETGNKEDQSGDDGPLSSPEALLEALRTAPADPRKQPGWEKIEPLERNRRLHRYRTDLAAWKTKHKFQGQTVSWTATVVKAEPGPNGRTMVLAQAQPGYWIQAHVAEANSDQRLSSSTGRIRITGRLASWNLDLRRVNIQEGKFFAVVAPAKVQVVAEAQEKPAGLTKASSKPPWAVALLVDCSKSMGQEASDAKFEMLRSVGKIGAESLMMGVALVDGRVVGLPQARLLPANRDSKTALAKALQGYKARGQANFPAAFEAAALRILQADAKAKAVYLFTDDPPELTDAFKAQLKKLTEANVWILFILVDQTPDEKLKAFRKALAGYKAKVDVRTGN